MATMMKMVLSVAVCLAYLGLKVDADPVGSDRGDAGVDQCQALNYPCNSSRCARRCESLDYQRGICVSTTIRCNATNFIHKRCKCLGNSTNVQPEAPSEAPGAGEGSSSNDSHSDSDSSDSDSSDSDSSDSSEAAGAGQGSSSNDSRSDSDSSDSSDSESSEATTTLSTSTKAPGAPATDSANATGASA